jgi:hypothetical protein
VATALAAAAVIFNPLGTRSPQGWCPRFILETPMKKLWRSFLSSLKKGNENQRKHIATMCNSLATVIVAQVIFLGTGVKMFLGIIMASGLWYISYHILDEEE